MWGLARINNDAPPAGKCNLFLYADHFSNMFQHEKLQVIKINSIRTLPAFAIILMMIT